MEPFTTTFAALVATLTALTFAALVAFIVRDALIDRKIAAARSQRKPQPSPTVVSAVHKLPLPAKRRRASRQAEEHPKAA